MDFNPSQCKQTTKLNALGMKHIIDGSNRWFSFLFFPCQRIKIRSYKMGRADGSDPLRVNPIFIRSRISSLQPPDIIRIQSLNLNSNRQPPETSCQVQVFLGPIVIPNGQPPATSRQLPVTIYKQGLNPIPYSLPPVASRQQLYPNSPMPVT